MLHTEFERECDRLSSAVDQAQFERMRWAREEGPMLARLADLTLAAIEPREDYDLAEEGSAGNIKRYVLKVHGIRVCAVAVGLVRGQAVMDAEAIERSRFRLNQGDPSATAYAAVDEAWIAAALQRVFSRIAA
ncbi:MAG: hypothetical protein ACKOQ3_15105 [Novosphingobium sp.]